MRSLIAVSFLVLLAAACGVMKKKNHGSKNSSPAGSTAEDVEEKALFGIWTSDDLIKSVDGLGSAKAYLQIEDGLVRLYNVCDFAEISDEKLVASVDSSAEISKDKIKILEIKNNEKKPNPFDTSCVAELTTDTFLYHLDDKKLIIENGDKEMVLTRIQGRAVAELTKN